jgi:hypothetical protein
MAMYHCEHVNDNEDHQVLQSFSSIDHIYEVYPTNENNHYFKLIKKKEILLCYELVYDNKDWMKQ